MLSDNQYLHFETIDSYEDAKEFIKDKNIYSPHKNYEREMENILSYKKTHMKKYKKRKNGKSAYRNIFAYYLQVMIPYEIDEKNYHEFTNRFMISISKKFKRLLYLYYFEKKGKGTYVNIMCFTRYAYKRDHTFTKLYRRDFCYNKDTKKLCSKDDPNAVIVHKAKTPVFDESGKKIRVKRKVQMVEEEIFKYSSFKKFVQKLKDKLKKVIQGMTVNWFSRVVIAKMTVKQEDTDEVRFTKYKRNQYISSINSIIQEYQEKLLSKYSNTDQIYEDFLEMINEVDEMVYTNAIAFKKIKDYMNEWWLKADID